jgi:hypothetical protein
MDKKELLELNLPIMLLGFKIDSLVKSLTEEQKMVYLKQIDTYKQIFLSKSAKFLTDEQVSEFLSMLDVD